jgi:hypothetical protein
MHIWCIHGCWWVDEFFNPKNWASEWIAEPSVAYPQAIPHLTFLPRSSVVLVLHPVQKSGITDQTYRISKAQHNTILRIIAKIVAGEDEVEWRSKKSVKLKSWNSHEVFTHEVLTSHAQYLHAQKISKHLKWNDCRKCAGNLMAFRSSSIYKSSGDSSWLKKSSGYSSSL